MKKESPDKQINIQSKPTEVIKKKIERKQKEPKKRLSKNADKKCSNKKQKGEDAEDLELLNKD